MPRSKRTKACDISAKVRKQVKERDGNLCFYCRKYVQSPQICHYISRGDGGLGIPENLVCGCIQCHTEADQGQHTPEYKKRMEEYLRSQYENWDNINLRYKKGYDG